MFNGMGGGDRRQRSPTRGGRVQAGGGECHLLGEFEGRWYRVYRDVACGVTHPDGHKGWVKYMELVSVLIRENWELTESVSDVSKHVNKSDMVAALLEMMAFLYVTCPACE